MSSTPQRNSAQKVLLETVSTPRTIATDYLLRRLGLNFRAGRPILGHQGIWRIPLLAVIPASPDVAPRRTDQLFYRFESFGEVLVDSSLKIVEAPTSTELNDMFQAELSRLFVKIERMIIDYGTDKWGRIPLIRSFLNPLNAIVSQALSLPSISLSQLEQQDYIFYAELLRRAGFLEESTERPDSLRKTNQLVAIAQKYRKEKGLAFYLDETAIDVTSIICSKFYPEVRERVRLLQSYVDTTVAYYVKAAKLKRLEPMTVGELEYSYNVLGRREQDTRVTFYGKVADLVTAGFLQWHSQGVVTGIEPIYSKIKGVGPELENNLHLLKANV